MKKSLLLTLSVLILSNSLSAQIHSKDPVVLKPVQELTSITVLKEQVNEVLFRPKPRSERSGIILCPPGTRKKPIPPDIIIDGEISSNELSSVIPDKIKSITVLRDETFTDREAGTKGVILIKTKGASARISKREPLVIIDGVVSRTGVMSIDPKTVRSISVLKDQVAIDAYGEAGSNGVVLVTTNGL